VVAVGVLGAGLGLVAAAFALFLFAHACEGSDVATAPRGGTLGNAVCASGVYVWNPLLWLAVGVLAIVAIPAALRRRCGRPMALAWLGGLGVVALSIVLSRIVGAASDSV